MRATFSTNLRTFCSGLALVLVGTIASACGGDDAEDPGSNPDAGNSDAGQDSDAPTGCNAGDERPCTCEGQPSGTQVCGANGTWGACTCAPACPEGYDDCDGQAANGCETKLGTDVACSSCDDVCGGNNASARCEAGKCVLDCDDGFADCDGFASTGCETELGTATNCSACDDVCSTTHAFARCEAGTCELVCDQGFGDCDGSVATGCETSLDSDDHCGGCDVSCNLANGTGGCEQGVCETSCNEGFADCDGVASNGCETDLSTVSNCGTCGNFCTGACVDGDCETCDTGLVLDSNDPLEAARALGICAGVVSASWVMPDGSVPTSNPTFAVGHGILPAFGPNVNAQEGASLLALSSGTARRPGDPGYVNPQGYSKGYVCSHPQGFPKESPACPGVTTGQCHDGIGLQVELTVPDHAAGFSFDHAFYTYEWPDYICSQYNDFFVALLSPMPAGQTDGNICFDAADNPISVNTSLLEACDCPGVTPCTFGGKTFACSLGASLLEGTGFDTRAATGWLVTQAPATPGSTVTLRFAIYDSGDDVLDSSVVIDNFRWLTSAPTVATTPKANPR
jgi:hypothetical protein